MALRIISSAQITLSNVYDSFNIVASNENFSIACDDSGNPLAGEIGQNGKAITSISVYRGTTKLTPVNSNPSVNQFAINITNQINCQCAKKDNDKIYINSLSSGITGKVVINVNIEGTNTATKEITFFKALNSLSDLIDGKFIFGLSNWSQNQNGIGDVGSNVKIIDSALSTYTSKLLEITNETWLYNKKAIDVQDDKIYEFKVRFKQSIDNTTGGKASYFGYTPYNSSGNAFGKDGSNNTYLIGGELLNTNSWKERTFYLSKTALPELNSGGKIIRPAVNAFPNGTVKFRPMFIVNYQNGNGVALVDYCTVTDVTDQFNIKELNYKTTTLEAKNGEINAAVENIKTFTQISNNPISLVAKVNYSSYDAPNDGEVYVHGLNSQKKSADIDGSCIWQDKKVVLPKQMFNPNGKVPEQEPIFMVRNIADNKWYSVWKENSTTWKRVVADVTANGTISTFTPSDTNDIFIGYYITRKSNNQNPETPIDMAQIFSNGALDYRQANAMSFASSISQLKIIQNEVSLKSSKDEMLMGINKWKRTKYKKTLASSDTFPTFNDIANLKPTTQDEVNDSTNLVAGMEGDDYFILHFFTNVFVKSAKNISITGKGVDDTATFFTNGIEVGRMNDSETVTMNLKTGWNTIEILFYEHNGGESMNINTKISSLVDNMAYGIGGQSSAITLTPNQIDVLSKNINIRGKVTFDSLADTNVSGSIKDVISKDGNRTIIDGGHIKANSIEANSLQINSVVDKINQDGTKSINGNKVTINGQGISSVFSTKTEVNDKIDKLQIGGRNLIKNSNIDYLDNVDVYNPNFTINYSFEDGWRKISWANGDLNNEVVQDKWIEIDSLGEYTFSILCKSDATNLGCSVTWFTSKGHDYQATKVEKINDGLWRIYSTKNVTEFTNIRVIDLGTFWTNGATYISLGLPKFEKGNKPTDWTPAPEDIDSAISNAQNDANNAKQAINDMANDNKLTPIEKQDTKKEFQVIQNEYERIKQQANTVSVNVDNYNNTYQTLSRYLTPLIADLSSTSDINGNEFRNNFTNYYNSRQDLLKTISDKLNNNINNIQVGGRNLLLKDDCDLTKWTIPKYKDRFDISFNNYNNVLNYKITSGGWEVAYRQISVIPNKEYVLSFDYKVYSKYNYLDSYQYSLEISTSLPSDNVTNNVIARHIIENSPTQLKRASIKFTPNVNTIYLVLNGGRILDGLNNIKFDFNKFKLEQGNKPTDWTPAPEDTINKISSIETKFDQTTKDITSRVSSTETSIRNIEKGSNQNLLYNADFAIMNGNLPDGWEVNPCVSFDKNNTTLDGMGSFWYDVTGQTEYHWYAAYSPMVQANKGQVFTASAYVLAYQNWQAVDDIVRIEIEYFNASGGRIDISGSSYNKSITAWQRLIVTGTCPDGTAKIRMRVHPTKNGRFNMSKPMLQVGEIATGWQRGFNAQDITTRLKSAESKVTDSAIINTVKNSSTFYTKQDIDNKNYQTASQVQTTANGVLNKFTSSGGYNLIRNSTAACANTSAWTTTGTLGYSASDTMGTDSRYYMYLDNGTNKDERYAFSSRFKLKPNKKYTFSGYFHNYTKCPNFDVFVLSSAVNENTNDTSYTVVNQLISAGNTNGKWQQFSATFTTASNVQSGYIRIDNNGYNANGTGDNRVNWNCIQLIEGEIERPWSPHPSEVYDGITMIDRNGVTVTASNANTRTNMSASGFKITKINNGEDIFRADQQGLFLKGRFQIESVVNGINKDLLDNSLKGDINNAVSNSNNALNKINGLDVGGRNFALKTSNDYSSPYNGFNGNDNMCPSISKVITKGLKVGDQITIRLIYNYSNIVAVSGKTVSCWIQGAGDVGQWNSGTFPSQKYYPIGSGEIEMLYTATLNESHLKNNSWEVSIRHDGVQSGSVKWKEFKVERGNKATGWTPAPEDTYTKDQLQNEINNANSAINISLKKIYTTGQIVDDKINNIKVGTKNLIRNSNFYKKNWDGWGFNNNPNNPATVEIIDDDRFTQCAKVTCKENFQGLYQGPDRTSGTKYSWSAWVKADSNCQLYVSHEQGDGSFYANIGTNWQRVEGSGVWRGNGGCLCFYATGEMTYYLANVKYVEGDKIPIDWTPAPEDVDKNISDTVSDAQETITLGYQNAINASAEQLSLTMSETYAKADDVSDQISSISSTLEQTASGLNATITSETKKVNDNLESYKETVSNYMRFDENGLSLGKTDSEFKTRLDNEKLSFQQNDEEVAYISNNKMNITDAEIKNKMILGSFEFIPRENGNLSLQWIRK